MRVVVATDDTLGPMMAGSALRAWELGRVLDAHGHDVLVVGGPGSQPPGPAGPVVATRAPRGWTEVLIAPPWSLPPRSFVGNRLLIADAITPLLAELENMPDDPIVVRRRRTAAARVPLVAARADAVLTGGPAQVEWWSDRLRGRFGLPLITSPFGVPEDPPPAEVEDIAGVPESWSVVLWWGGVWPWLDLETLLEARARLGQAPVSLVIPVARRPGSASPGLQLHGLAAALRAHGLQPPQVVALERWVPYSERHRILNRASLVAVLHRSGDEAALSFRTRALDAVWAGVPLLITEGGEVSRIASQSGWGGVVPPGDPAAVAAAIELLLTEREQARCRLSLSHSRPQWTWRQTTRPLLTALPQLPKVPRGPLLPAALRALLALARPTLLDPES